MKVNCKECDKEFNKKPSQIAKSKNNFCSRKCVGIHRITKTLLKCDQCGSDIQKKPSDITKSKNGVHFCNKTCSGLYRTGERSGNWKGGSYSYRDAVFKDKEKECEECGYDEYPQVIEVHHIDHDRTNNDVTNLKVLCPTCHRIEHLVKFSSTSDKPVNEDIKID